MYERMRKRCEIAGQRISLGANHERDFEYRRGSQPIRGHISIRGADLAARVGIMSYTAAFFFFLLHFKTHSRIQGAYNCILHGIHSWTPDKTSSICYFLIPLRLLTR